MLDRIVGVAILRAPSYREIADDQTATGPAAVIVIVVSLILGIIAGYGRASTAGLALVPSAVAVGISQLVTALIAWAIGSWLAAFLGKVIFHGRTNTLEMLRVFGFTWIFRVIGIVPVVGFPIGVILSVIANIVAIREVAELDSSKAILTAVMSGLVIAIVIAGGMIAGNVPL